MKRIKQYQVDVFTDRLFCGNPAAVCFLDQWLEGELMQNIAMENNLAETAFVINREGHFEIRWFTPTVEVDLCGHATLAAAYVLFHIVGISSKEVIFYSPRSGELSVTIGDDILFLNFPTDTLATANEYKHEIKMCLGVKVIEVYKGKTDYIAIIESEKIIKNLKPDLQKISELKARGLVVSAKGNSVDFVSRFFAPQSGINEDPVTGSSHTSLIPIWAEKLNKDNMTAQQLSERGGQLYCEYKKDRCLIGGKAKVFLTGEIYIN